jgi:hypothetical protein
VDQWLDSLDADSRWELKGLYDENGNSIKYYSSDSGNDSAESHSQSIVSGGLDEAPLKAEWPALMCFKNPDNGASEMKKGGLSTEEESQDFDEIDQAGRTLICSGQQM